MNKRQFRVLYREFLFRMVDRDLLAVHAQGDASKLLGQFAAALILMGVLFTLQVGSIKSGHEPREAVLISGWGMEHSLIAATMLLVGLFAVLSWDSMLPDRRDVLVLAPLPVRANTIFLAKVAALGMALSFAVVTFNAVSGLVLPLALAPSSSSLLDMLVSLDFYRTLVVYWITVFAAGAFVLCCVLGVQGIAAQLPRRLFLRVSALLQISIFCVLLCGYLLQPSWATPGGLTAAAHPPVLRWLPSYWFLGLFQELNGSLNQAARTTLISLAQHAWIGLGGAVFGAGAAFLLSYFRTLRKIVEEPDIVPASHLLTWLPRFGNSLETAVVQFSIRTLLRSRQHRVIFSFYSGMGFAILILFLRTPVARQLSAASAANPWHQVSVAPLASSFLMVCFWTLGIRMVFAMPLELQANWILRVIPFRRAADYLRANRRAMFVLALLPLWAASAVLFLALWPWYPAVEHLAVLGLLGIVLVELCLHGFQKIPFTCSYLPGKSNFQITFWLCLMGGLNLTLWGAELERRSLADPVRYGWLIVILCAVAACARWRTDAHANSRDTAIHFEEEQEPVIMSLGLHRD